MRGSGGLLSRSPVSEATQVPEQLLLQQQQQQQQQQPSSPDAQDSDPTKHAQLLASLECQQPKWPDILISLGSMSIAAYFVTSSVMQLTLAIAARRLCGISFSSYDIHEDTTWLVASCIIAGLMRLFLGVCIGRPSYNRTVRHQPSNHPAYVAQIEALAFLPDVRPQSRDMSVLDRAQLASGIIHPAFYHRTLLIAWQEGLLTFLWLILHLMRIHLLNCRFTVDRSESLWNLDYLLDELYTSLGSNFTTAPLVEVGHLMNCSATDLVERMSSDETIDRLVAHTCEITASTVAYIFYLEDLWLLILLGAFVLLLPMLSRLCKFYSR